MPHTAKTRQRLIYVLIAALVAPLLLLQTGNRSVEPMTQMPEVVEDSSVKIGSITAERVGEHVATITWETDVPADSQVTYGQRSAFEHGTRRDPELTVDHRVTLRNLESGATYFACLVSASVDGGIGTSEGVSFRTHGVAGFREAEDGDPLAAVRDLPSKASGVAPRDYDNDGDLDLLVCAENYKGSRLFRNDKGVLTDVTKEAGLLESARAGAWADYDGDGDSDLVLSSGWKLHLFENAGAPSWQFRDANKLLPRQARYSTEGIGWLDYDRDGRPDLLIANGAYGILLYHNTGRASPRFKDVSRTAGLGPKGIGVGLSDFLSIADLNGDGLPDFLYNIRGRTCLFAKNTGWGRFEAAENTGLDYKSRQRIGFALGDYDNDGDLDVFVPMSMGNKLLRNEGKAHFRDVTDQAGALKDSTRGSSAAWGDVDNDGDLDLYVGRWYSADELYANNGDGTFRLASKEFRIDQESRTTARGTLFFDYDRDGDLDLFVNNRRSANTFFVNENVFAGQHNYLEVELAPKLAQAGTTVTLHSKEGKMLGYRHISGGEGWGCQLPSVAHFGCKPGKYLVRVTLPSKREVKKPVSTTANGPNILRIE